MNRKNYCFYMVADFDTNLDKIMQNSKALSGLSKSQSLYYIISRLAQANIDVGSDEQLADLDSSKE